MNNKTKISTTLPNGTKVEYDVILTFKNTTNNKNYVVYTDNNYDQNNKLRIFAALYTPDTNSYLGEPITTEEWNEIINILDNVLIKK